MHTRAPEAHPLLRKFTPAHQTRFNQALFDGLGQNYFVHQEDTLSVIGVHHVRKEIGNQGPPGQPNKPEVSIPQPELHELAWNRSGLGAVGKVGGKLWDRIGVHIGGDHPIDHRLNKQVWPEVVMPPAPHKPDTHIVIGLINHKTQGRQPKDILNLTN